MKRLLFFVLLLTALVFCLTGCDTILSSFNIPLSDGVFEYTLNEDKSSYTLIGLKEDKAENIVIPEAFNDMPVTAIGSSAFEQGRITGVKISSSIKSIGAHAFALCGNLSDVAFSGGDIKLESFAFSFTNLTSIELPEGITEIEPYVFSNCKNLAEVKLPKSLTEICYSAFANCESLASVNIPCGVKKMGKNAFQRTALKNAVIPASVTELAPNAFSFCEDMSNITVDEENPVYKSEDGVLYSKDGSILVLYPQGKAGESFSVPEDVTQIGEFAFYCAENLNSIVLCDGINVICSEAFTSCGLRDVYIPDSVETVCGRAFGNCAYLEKVVIGIGVTEIGKGTFESCFRLKEVIIGDSVKCIGERAFVHCRDLISVSLPKSIESIGINAFGDCPSMKSVFFSGNFEEWENMPVSPECGDGLVGVDVYCFAESQPETEGKFWHYSAFGEPIVW